MSSFLLLCEYVGTAYRIDDFINQASAVLGQIENAKGNWLGISRAARTAATVQRLADANSRRCADQRKVFCSSLDALIDLGDRRSAALEQTEAFKSVQVRQSSEASGAPLVAKDPALSRRVDLSFAVRHDLASGNPSTSGCAMFTGQSPE
jgi:hypothetical protein